MKARDSSYSSDLGERIPYVIIKNGETKTRDKGEDPLWTIQHGLEIDYMWYLEKQISPAVARLMSWVIGNRDLIRPIEVLERKCIESMHDSVCAEKLRKDTTKLLDALYDDTKKRLFGHSALCSIPRKGKLSTTVAKSVSSFFRVQKRCIGCCKTFVDSGCCDACLRDGTANKIREQYRKRMDALVDEERRLMDVCSKCRGY